MKEHSYEETVKARYKLEKLVLLTRLLLIFAFENYREKNPRRNDTTLNWAVADIWLQIAIATGSMSKLDFHINDFTPYTTVGSIFVYYDKYGLSLFFKNEGEGLENEDIKRIDHIFNLLNKKIFSTQFWKEGIVQYAIGLGTNPSDLESISRRKEIDKIARFCNYFGNVLEDIITSEVKKQEFIKWMQARYKMAKNVTRL